MKVSDVVYHWEDGAMEKLEAETADFEHVVGIELGGGYDWDDLQAWYSPSRRKFFWLDGSGCSCNSLGDSVYSLANFESGNRDELAGAVRRKYDESYSSRSGLVTEALAKLAVVKTFQPGQARMDAST